MKVTGSNITITDSVVNKMNILPLGNCEQDGLPTPDNPIDVKVVTGDNQLFVCNKNLINRQTCSENKILAWVTGAELSENNSLVTDYIKVIINNTYSLLNKAGYIFFYNQNKEYLGALQNNNTIAKTAGYLTSSFTVPNIANIYYIRIVFRAAYNPTILTDNIQLEVGSVATDYVEHAEQSTTLHLRNTYLAGIGDYKDKIVGYKDNWKIVRNVGKRIFTGVNDTSLENLYICMLSDYLNQYGFCSHFTFYTDTLINNNADADSILSNGECAFRSGSTKDRLYFKSTKTKAELDLLNKEVYYVLSEPTEETITDTSLVQSLNELNDLMSYDGTTNITITSDSNNAQMIVEVTYTSESDMNEKLANIFNSIKSKLYHIIRAL